MSAPDDPIRLTAVMAVARASLVDTGPVATVEVLVDRFGWDPTFQALLLLRGGDAERALLLSMQRLLPEATV